MILTTELVDSGDAKTFQDDAPTLEDVKTALNRLDGATRTRLWLADVEGSYLQVAGPVEGRYALDLTLANGKYLHAKSDDSSGGVVSVPAGIDEVELPRKTLVPRAVAEAALVYFFSERAPAPSVLWEPNG